MEEETPHGEIHPSGLSKARVETLTDGIFAIAMTLLVLSIEVPQAGSPPPLRDLLASLYPDIILYVLAFLALAVFWVLHHQMFHFIRSVDSFMLWLNVIWLLFVGLMPFTSNLADTYFSEWLAEVIFGANVLVIAFIVLAEWHHVTRNPRMMDPSVDKTLVGFEMKRGEMVTGIAFLGTILAAFGIFPGVAVFALIPVVFALSPQTLDYLSSKSRKMMPGKR
ncbi:putative membrane protein [Methanolinea mesophila]|uniref:TMEM175 family protein n=1 Tax=Methanolinea mesophila TaxID=547055 RepID=UPI001AEA3A1A|nr:TMEM175 family protein [Methanolinea mesophila]MBP1929933.1 putative membrane protein [Methanolinea mesophila]